MRACSHWLAKAVTPFEPGYPMFRGSRLPAGGDGLPELLLEPVGRRRAALLLRLHAAVRAAGDGSPRTRAGRPSVRRAVHRRRERQNHWPTSTDAANPIRSEAVVFALGDQRIALVVGSPRQPKLRVPQRVNPATGDAESRSSTSRVPRCAATCTSAFQARPLGRR